VVASRSHAQCALKTIIKRLKNCVFTALSCFSCRQTNQTISNQPQTVNKQQNGGEGKLNINAKQFNKAHKKTEFLAKKGWRKRPSAADIKAIADKKRLAKKFKGANKAKLAGLSAERLAAYGLKKKKKNDD